VVVVVVGGAGAGQLARWFEDKLAVTHSALSQLISHQHQQHHQQQQRWHDPRSASLAAETTSAALVDWKSQYRTHHSVSLPRHPRIYGARTLAREGGLCGWLDG
jgi:hypothetical protein